MIRFFKFILTSFFVSSSNSQVFNFQGDSYIQNAFQTSSNTLTISLQLQAFSKDSFLFYLPFLTTQENHPKSKPPDIEFLKQIALPDSFLLAYLHSRKLTLFARIDSGDFTLQSQLIQTDKTNVSILLSTNKLQLFLSEQEPESISFKENFENRTTNGVLIGDPYLYQTTSSPSNHPSLRPFRGCLSSFFINSLPVLTNTQQPPNLSKNILQTSSCLEPKSLKKELHFSMPQHPSAHASFFVPAFTKFETEIKLLSEDDEEMRDIDRSLFAFTEMRQKSKKNFLHFQIRKQITQVRFPDYGLGSLGAVREKRSGHDQAVTYYLAITHNEDVIDKAIVLENPLYWTKLEFFHKKEDVWGLKIDGKMKKTIYGLDFRPEKSVLRFGNSAHNESAPMCVKYPKIGGKKLIYDDMLSSSFLYEKCRAPEVDYAWSIKNNALPRIFNFKRELNPIPIQDDVIQLNRHHVDFEISNVDGLGYENIKFRMLGIDSDSGVLLTAGESKEFFTFKDIIAGRTRFRMNPNSIHSTLDIQFYTDIDTNTLSPEIQKNFRPPDNIFQLRFRRSTIDVTQKETRMFAVEGFKTEIELGKIFDIKGTGFTFEFKTIDNRGNFEIEKSQKLRLKMKYGHKRVWFMQRYFRNIFIYGRQIF